MIYGLISPHISTSGQDQIKALHLKDVEVEDCFLELDKIPLSPGDTLFVYCLSVFEKTIGQLYESLHDLATKDITVISITEDLTLTDNYFLRILNFLIRSTTEVKSLKMKIGIKIALAKGKGRRPVIGSKEEEIIRELIGKGRSKAAICRAIGVTKPTLLKWLKEKK